MRTWYFKELFTGDISAVEPGGTEHFVRNGDMNSAAGRRLLSAMASDLCTHPAPGAPSDNCAEAPPRG